MLEESGALERLLTTDVFKMLASGSRFFPALLCISILAGCSSLPNDGPLKSDILDQASNSENFNLSSYVLIKLDLKTAERLPENRNASLLAAFGDNPAESESEIQPGDYVTMTIWQVGSTDLFSSSVTAPPTTTQSETIPEQEVDKNGTVEIPFAGRVVIGGMSLHEANAKIRQALSGKAGQPQALISLSRNTSDNVVVIGDDIKSLSYTLSPNADKILDVIAAAGGAQSPIYQTRVGVLRDGHYASLELGNLMITPGENIHLHPHDILSVFKNPGSVTALGALGRNVQIQFQNNHMTLAEAIGNAGGLSDDRAEPSGTFVFRFEPKEQVESICPACYLKDKDASVPVVFQLDLRKPDAIFASQRFFMADHDVIFVSNSSAAQLEKFLSMVRDFFSPILAGAVVERAVTR